MEPSPRTTQSSTLAFLLTLAAIVTPAHLDAQPGPDLVITDVHVVDVRRGEVLPGRTVVVSDGRVVSIQTGPAPQLSGARVIDAAGGYLIPGLLDMHAHLRGNGIPPWVTTDWMMPLILAHGVTGVRDMGSDCDGPNQGPVCRPQVLEWQEAIESGSLIGPRILSTGSFLINPPWDYEVSEAEARGLVQAMAQAGVMNLKIYDRLSPDALGWIADEASQLGMTVWGHVPLRMTAAEASAQGLRSIEHARDFLFDCFPGSEEFRRTARSSTAPVSAMREMVDGHDSRRCAATFQALVDHDTWYVPTHVTRRRDALARDAEARNDPRRRYVIPLLFADWMQHLDRVVQSDSVAEGANVRDFYLKGLEITGAAHRAGVRILVGTDAPDPLVFPGSAVHDELGELVAAGLSPAEALRAATWNGAEFLGLTSQYGSIEEGKRADFVLLDANPLADIANTRRIRSVIFRGEHLDREALDRMLEEVEVAAQRSLMPEG